MVAGLILCELVISVLAAAMAWSLARFSGLLDWPRRGVWAAAMLCSLALPIIFMMDSWQQNDSTSTARSLNATPSGAAPTFAPVDEPAASSARLIAPRTLPDRTIDAPSTSTLALQLRLPVLPQWDGVLSTLWIASSIIALCLLSASMLHVSRLVRGLPQTYADDVRVLVSAGLGPAVFGWLRPVIVVPGAVLTSEHRKLVLMHEQSHAQARDPLLFGALLAAVALAPWNPVLWWQLRQLRFAIEVDCDRRVLRAGIDVASYGQMLLQMAQLEHRLPLGALALTEPVSQLGKRVAIMTTVLSMRERVGLAVIAFSVLGVSAAIAAQLEPPERPQAASVAADGTQNVLGAVRSTLMQSGVPSPAEMAARAAELQAALDDPERRAALREERRPQIRGDYPDLAEFLGMDPMTGQQLIDLIADQSLESDLRQLRVPPRMVQIPSDGNSVVMEPVNRDEMFKAAAADVDRHRAALQRFLGEARFGRYLDYVARQPVRQELARFSERLGQEQLSSYQTERMVELLMVERGIHLSNVAIPPPDLAAYMRREVSGLLRDWLSDAERNVQWALARRDRLVRNAAAVLTPSQLAALERVENERIDAQRSNLDGLRRSSAAYAADVGGAATPPARAAVARRMLTGRVRWSVTLAVDEAEPKVTSFLSNFGERESFDAGEGLWVEATPMAYDAKRLTVDLKIYETDASGVRHLIDDRADAADFGAAAPTREELAKRRVVLAGSKSYRLAFSVAGSLQ